mmetsp:Transcript_27550/g.51405  ORF Transcript_27550/g.51405 Transcript_27550/m.51405 type:complete len:460 (-) Transcript_27550:1385-2764(-)
MIKVAVLLGAAVVALGFFEESESEVFDPEVYRCQDGHEVSVDMEFQCLEMYIGQTAYAGDDLPKGWGEQGWNATEGFASYALNLRDSFNETEFVGNRRKHGHEFGVVLPIAWKSTKAAKQGPYTGLFRTGGKKGFLRFSIPKLAFAPEGPSHNKASAVAVKLLRRLSPSGNILFISTGNDTGLIPSRLSTHATLTSNGSWLARAHASTLQSYTDFPGFMGMSRFAAIDRFGITGDETVFPFEVHLVATKALRSLAVPEAATAAKMLTATRDSIPSGGKLFDVYAIAEPRTFGEGDSCVTLTSRFNSSAISTDECNWKKIGGIYAQGAAKISTYGDEVMHFSHTRFEDDLEYECAKSWKLFLLSHGVISKTRLADGVSRFVSNAAMLFDWLIGVAREAWKAIVGPDPAAEAIDETDSSDEPEHPHGSLEGKDVESCPYMAALKKAREAKEAEEKAKAEGA